MKLPNDTPQGFICWVPDLLGSTRFAMMSLAQRGIFWTLLCRQWELLELPTDLGMLARLAMSERSEFVELWTPPLSDAFKASKNGLQNPKLERVREAQNKKRAAGSKGGSASGAKRQAKTEQTRSKGTTKKEPSVSVSDSSSVSGSDSGSTPKKKPRASVYSIPPLSDYGLNRTDVLAAWEAWKGYRRSGHFRPWTPATVVKVLEEYRARPFDLIDAINLSISKGWQGLFPPKKTRESPKSKSGAPGTLGELAAANRTRKKPAKPFPPKNCPSCETGPASWETIETDLNDAGEDAPSLVRCLACTGTLRRRLK